MKFDAFALGNWQTTYYGPARQFWMNYNCRSEKWIHWSNSKPDISRSLWPKVIEILSNRNDSYPSASYHLAGMLMLLVENCDDLESYSNALCSWQQYERDVVGDIMSFDGGN